MSYLEGKSILITGGAGSLGQNLVRCFLSGQYGTPKRITVFSRNETNQHEMKINFKSPKINYFLGDMRDRIAVHHVVEGQDIIIHAASMKHVGNCTAQPDLAWEINVTGTEHLVDATRQAGVETVLNISSDKGKNPENWYGRTKYEQEKRILDANRTCLGTRFIAVCYGNVMASNGSVIQKWHTKITKGEPIQVTDPSMTRFLISLPQAVDTVMAALGNARRGEIYIPIIPSATIGDLAEVMVDGRPVEVQVIGRMPEEKVHETLTTEEEAQRLIKRDKWYVVSRTIQDVPALAKPYISKDYLISKQELRDLLDKYGLLIKEAVAV